MSRLSNNRVKGVKPHGQVLVAGAGKGCRGTRLAEYQIQGRIAVRGGLDRRLRHRRGVRCKTSERLDIASHLGLRASLVI